MAKVSKTLTFTLALLMFAALFLSAGAESVNHASQSSFSAKGVIQAPKPVTVFSPMGGQLTDFSWESGDQVEQGETAFSLLPAQVYAQADGVIAGLHAQTGDNASAVMSQYGALCYINPEDIWHIEATITSTTDKVETRDVVIGQTLRVQRGTGDDKARGEGLVISRSDKSFTLEMKRGEFDIEDSVKIYLGSSKDNARTDQIGSGKVVRPASLAVAGEGIVASVLVKEGDAVRRGQPLIIFDSASARYEAAKPVEPEALFTQAGIVSEVMVQPGQFVQQGQALMTIFPEGSLEAALEVDELDIAGIRLGDTLRVSVDAYGQERTGTVIRINPVGRVALDTTKYTVKVSFSSSDDLMIGMHVKAYKD